MIDPNVQKQAIAEFRRSIDPPKHPVKVLVVEDNEHDAFFTLSSLKAVGVEPTWARDPKETEAYMVANDPWMVFLDLQLGSPGSGSELGLDVLALIRAFKPDCHIIILTGQHRRDSVYCVEALSAGAKMVMLKPFTIEDAQLIFLAP